MCVCVCVCVHVIIKIHDTPPAKKFTYDIIIVFLGLLLKGEAVDVKMKAQLPRRREGGREGGR